MPESGQHASEPVAMHAGHRRNVYNAMMDGIQIGATNARLDALGEKIDDLGQRMEKGFEKVNQRFDKVNERFDERFDKVDERFHRLHQALIGGGAVMLAALVGLIATQL